MQNSILDLNKLFLDADGIYKCNSLMSDEIKISQSAWENIYNFDLNKLKEDRNSFDRDKLKEHVHYLDMTGVLNEDTVYLEIGCGPAHIGEYILRDIGGFFIGIDFNYKMLLTLKAYFDEKGYTKYILIHGDINDMPLLDNSIDFIYGGGVIEHFPDTTHILKESYRVLKAGGISFNTIPAFNLWWIFRFYNNIPYTTFLKKIFEFIHIRIFKGSILRRNWGYELSYTPKELYSLHEKIGFKGIKVLPFAFYPSKNRMKNKILREIYYFIQKSIITSAVYLVYGKK